MDAILFDCDGALVDSEILAIEVGLDHLKRVGLEPTRDDNIARFVGRSSADIAQIVEENFFGKTGSRLPDNYFEVLERHELRRINEDLETIKGASSFIEMSSNTEFCQ